MVVSRTPFPGMVHQTDNAQLAHVSAPWTGSRPELVVKAVPMLAS